MLLKLSWSIGIVGRVFSNGPGDRSSIPGRVISEAKKKKKWYLIPPCLTQHYKVWIKGKWTNPRKGVVPSSTPWCSRY